MVSQGTKSTAAPPGTHKKPIAAQEARSVIAQRYLTT